MVMLGDKASRLFLLATLLISMLSNHTCLGSIQLVEW